MLLLTAVCVCAHVCVCVRACACVCACTFAYGCVHRNERLKSECCSHLLCQFVLRQGLSLNVELTISASLASEPLGSACLPSQHFTSMCEPTSLYFMWVLGIWGFHDCTAGILPTKPAPFVYLFALVFFRRKCFQMCSILA